MQVPERCLPAGLCWGKLPYGGEGDVLLPWGCVPWPSCGGAEVVVGSWRCGKRGWKQEPAVSGGGWAQTLAAHQPRARVGSGPPHPMGTLLPEPQQCEGVGCGAGAGGLGAAARPPLPCPFPVPPEAGAVLTRSDSFWLFPQPFVFCAGSPEEEPGVGRWLQLGFALQTLALPILKRRKQ